jgi:hypothetical protein
LSLAHLGRAALALAVCFTLITADAALAAEGSVNFVGRNGSDFDRFSSSGLASDQDWIRRHFPRMQVYSPYFDNKTSWYPGGLMYADLYAIYRDSDLARQHPEWILHSASGAPLYIPWGCSGGTCPQYAADIKNPAFRAWWIEAAAHKAVALGYRGLWVDDVNLDFRVGDGNGQFVAPIDSDTGAAMSETAWRRAMAEFTEQIRAAVPSSFEILHNSIWYAGGSARDRDSYVQREILAADTINLERGTNDGGLTGGSGAWSLNAVLGFIDRVHALGRNVVLDAYDDSASGRAYNLANYFLASNGQDGVGDSEAAPDNWWNGWDVDLGAAAGPRTTWNGLLRRDFACGLVLVNEPQAPVRTVALPAPMLTVDGRTVTSVSLGATQGAILRYAPASGVVPPTATATPTPAPVTPAPAPVSPAPGPVAPGSTPTPAPPAARTPVARTSGRRAAPKVPTHARISRHGARVRVHGRVAAAAAGSRLRIKLQLRRGSQWRAIRARSVRPSAKGAYAARFTVRAAGRLRARVSAVPATAKAACARRA